MANLRVAELDFDEIKSNLKTFLQAQDEFTDYDFEGAGLSVLIDLLAYNTHYNAYLANMVVNEMFLDSAVKRSSAVSIAKHLGYTPRSTLGSTAVIDITVNNPVGNPTTLTLPRFTPFSTSIDGTYYSFLVTEPQTITPVDETYVFNNVTIKQGVLLSNSFTVVSPGSDTKYEIPNPGIDTTTMVVTVQNSATDTTTTTYTLSQGLADVNNTSTVYYLEENAFGNYQIYFGDGVLGKLLEVGNIITVSYLTCEGSATNVSASLSQTFAASAPIGGSSNIIVDVITNSTGGAAKETITSIKYNAPKTYAARNRAVTKSDYTALIKASYPQIEAVSVWGGEENTPPIYGKVFISLKPYDGYNVNEQLKQSIKNNILKERQMLTVTSEFVDPDYIYVGLDVTVGYNTSRTTLSASRLSTLVNNSILSFFNGSMQQFELPFYHSALTKTISGASSSIVSVLALPKLQKRIIPVLNTPNSFVSDTTIKFDNKSQPGTFTSTVFFINYIGTITPVVIKDIPDTMPPNPNGAGILRLYNFNSNADLGAVGAINYRTGEVTIASITPVGFPSGQYDIRFNVNLQIDSYNVNAAKNQIITYDDSTKSIAANRSSGISVTIVAV